MKSKLGGRLRMWDSGLISTVPPVELAMVFVTRIIRQVLMP